ncbi:MAG: glycoside hydrolase family 76 protein [Bacteroidaceae bacterium]
MKGIITSIFVSLCLSTSTLAYNSTLANYVKGEYGGKADSLAKVLVDEFMYKSKGTFWSTPKDVEHSSTYIYWQQAHAMDVLVYAYERHVNDTDKTLSTRYKSYIRLWYVNHANNYSSGATGFENPYTDDMCWICLTLLHMTEATGLETYATTAKKLFDNAIMARAKEDDSGLWLPWNTDADAGPNACTLSPACLIAAKLYNKYGAEEYLEYAEKFYTYMQKNIVKTDGRVEEPPLTYTQGTFAEACRQLYHITGKSVYRTQAQQYIEYAFTSTRCTNGANILRDEGSSMDQSIFKAVLIPYAVNYVLDEKMLLTSRLKICRYIQLNANTLWSSLDKESYPAMYCPYNWTTPYDASKTASMGAMTSGASLMENCARMCISLTTPEVPDAISAPKQETNTWVKGIYNLSGQRVANTHEALEQLPSGLYVIDGRKEWVR